jgi:two-component system, chemotaxis family, CheB/CheR fusion protein
MQSEELLSSIHADSQASFAAQDDAVTVFKILDKVFRVTGVDFRGYRQATIIRRLGGRLQAVGADTCNEYLEFLGSHPEEYGKFLNHMSITVSDFLRTPYAFQQIVRLVLPELVSRKGGQEKSELKFWSAATARGQEAYSIAFVLADYLKNRLEDFDISILATDINRRSLIQAKSGSYSLKDVEHLPHGILERYFTRSAAGFEVNSDIRQMVDFRYFNLASTAPPPFISQDCIFCCNILIYLEKKVQEKVIAMLCDSLAAPGYLVLGEAETLPVYLDMKLELIDYKAKIYKKTGRF